MVQKSQTSAWDVFETLRKIMGLISTINLTSTGWGFFPGIVLVAINRYDSKLLEFPPKQTPQKKPEKWPSNDITTIPMNTFRHRTLMIPGPFRPWSLTASRSTFWCWASTTTARTPQLRTFWKTVVRTVVVGPSDFRDPEKSGKEMVNLGWFRLISVHLG